MAGPFASYIDPDGNIYMQAGSVISLGSTTTHFSVGANGVQIALPTPPDAFPETGMGSGGFFGGSGSNVSADTTVLGTLVPAGFFLPSEPDVWTAGTLTMTFDPGTGGAEIDDGTDVLAELPAGSATTAPYGNFASTAYGETTYNAGNPFTVATTYEGGNPWGRRAINITSTGSTIQTGIYSRTDWQAWQSDDDPNWTLTLDGTGAGVINDGTDDVLTRAADATNLYDPTSGIWECTAYGETNYGTAFFYAEVTFQISYPIAGYLYVTLDLDANDEVTGVTGPFFAASLPANSATEVSVPVAYSNGSGSITQIQLGPIIWRPAP